MKQIPCIHIAGRRIARDETPYVIAEMSANHNGKIETAFKIIEEAKKAGADAVKLQTYTADTITLDCDTEEFQIRGGLWDGKTLYQLYQEAHMPWDWHKPLFEHARKLGITIFSSPFDNTAVDLLEDLNAPAYKIASFEAVDLPLIEYVAGTGKPIIISTGMANECEISEALDVAMSGKSKEVVLLHCVSGYPAPVEDYNLRTITDMYERFKVPIGLSDHTLDNNCAVAAVALGACVIEKHFTLDKYGGGPDDSFSLQPSEMSNLCKSVSSAWRALGSVNYGCKMSEKDNIKFRRSIYFCNALKAGDVISEKDILSVRPGYGMPTKFFKAILGRRLLQDVQYGTPVTEDILDH